MSLRDPHLLRQISCYDWQIVPLDSDPRQAIIAAILNTVFPSEGHEVRTYHCHGILLESWNVVKPI